MSTLLSQLQVCLSAEGPKNVSWPWLSLLQGWGNLTMAFAGKFLYIDHHFVLLWPNPFDLRIDRDGGLNSRIIVVGLLVSRGCLKRVLAMAISAPRMG